MTLLGRKHMKRMCQVLCGAAIMLMAGTVILSQR